MGLAKKKMFRSYIIVSSLGLGSFTAGVYCERNNLLNTYHTIKKMNLPAIPLFATVSAASPISTAAAPSNLSRVSQIMKYGFPGLDNIRSYDDFVLSYDRRNRVAHWVFEHLTADNVKKNQQVDRGKCDFQADETIHEFFRFVQE